MTSGQDSRLDPKNVEGLLYKILRSDKESDVVAALRRAGFWDDDKCWRLYGDTAKNFASAGNQQRSPEAALVEKIINSVDACLLRRCLEQGIDPRSPEAPSSIREAVAMFLEGRRKADVRDHQGLIKNWTSQKRTEASRDITLALTGPRPGGGRPSVTIVDAGEGQTPDSIPDTILSLDKGLKDTVTFVQGKFNMGGTGVLRFCGTENLQLVLTKRCPGIRSPDSSDEWGFTIVRREYPDETRRISVYRYLAPLGSEASANHGGVLRLRKESLAILPEGQKPYSKEARFGTLMKLYEFDTKARTHMFMRSGLQERLDLLIPGLALPVRLHECRPYGGSPGSFETTLAGLEVRLTGSSNLESSFPDTGELHILGERIRFTIYAFKRGSGRTYRRNEGILFVVNGQTHAVWQDRFFRHKRVGMSYLADSILVVLDCSDLSGRTKEELFMNSRDRLAESELAARIEEELEDLLSRHEGLRALREQRRQEDTASKLGDSKPLEDALNEILKKSPSLTALFLKGERLSNPFATVEVQVGTEYVGKLHPTVFKFKDRPYGEVLRRSCHLGQRLRITFDTDVVNDYFKRDMNGGSLSVEAWLNSQEAAVDYTMNLHDGFAHVNIRLPDGCQEKDNLKLVMKVTDPTLVEPFVSEAELAILGEQVSSRGSGGRRSRPDEKDPAGKTELRPAGIALPKITEVTREHWPERGMTEESALRIVQAEGEDLSKEGEGKHPVFDFFINVDNIYLRTEEKASPGKADLTAARFKFGMVLVGLGLLRQSVQANRSVEKNEEDSEASDPPNAEDMVAYATDALAPMLLPMIETLGELEVEELISYGDESGDGSHS